MKRRLWFRVSRFLSPDRQQVIRRTHRDEPVDLRPDGQGGYRVWTYTGEGQDGYQEAGRMPDDLARQIAPVVHGEPLIGEVMARFGGDEYRSGVMNVDPFRTYKAPWGLLIEIVVPDYAANPSGDSWLTEEIYNE